MQNSLLIIQEVQQEKEQEVVEDLQVVGKNHKILKFGHQKINKIMHKLMKLWKATQRQCLPVISNIGRFAFMKQKIKLDDQYKQELKQYEESIKEIPKIGPDGTFDFEDLVMHRREKAVAAAASPQHPQQ